MALRDGMPDYLDEMDKMFTRFVADGSTSYAPGQQVVHDIPSDDAEDEEQQEPDDQDVATPVSVGSKRTSSSRSTPSLRSTSTSPNKKVKSPAVRAICEKLGGSLQQLVISRGYFNDTLRLRAVQREAAEQASREAAEWKRKEEEEQVDLIIRLAKECGFTESSPEWIGVLNILESEKAIIWFLKNGVEGRKQTIEAYANRV
jgi:hypothetical protein